VSGNCFFRLKSQFNILILNGMLRFQTIRRRTKHHLGRLQQRDHIVVGLIAAITKIDDIIKVIKASDSIDSAKTELCGERFQFTNEQVMLCGLTHTAWVCILTVSWFVWVGRVDSWVNAAKNHKSRGDETTTRARRVVAFHCSIARFDG
jgi:hypothetical protein